MRTKIGLLIFQVKMLAESMLADVIEKLVDAGSKYEKEYKIFNPPR